MTADELVEAVARAIAAYPSQPDAQARAAIRAVHAAMREPSDVMVHQGGAAHDHPSVYMGGPSHNGRTKAERIWRAMLAASPLAEAARDDD